MNIGFDFDGVILDSERNFKFYSDYWTHFVLGKDRLRDDEVTLEDCFDWTDAESAEFYASQFDEITRKSDIMVGAKEILTRLKSEGHKIYVVTLRGYYREEERAEAELKLKELGIEFDEVCWAASNKCEICKKLGIQVMVDDNPDNIEQFANNEELKVLYFKEQPIRNVALKNVSVVSSWMDIYREVSKLSDKK